MKTILIGYDESAPAERALTRAADLAAALDARLVIACITRESTTPARVPALEPDAAAPPVVLGSAAPAVIVPEPPVGEPAEDDVARHHLERAKMAIAERPVKAEYVSASGDAADGLLQLAEERDADLIVVGSREHGGFIDRLLGRGVDETVADRSRRDVLLVR